MATLDDTHMTYPRRTMIGFRAVLLGAVVCGSGWWGGGGVMPSPAVAAGSFVGQESGVAVVPVRRFVAAGQPIRVRVEASAPVELLLQDFIGRATSARSTTPVVGEVDLMSHFELTLARPGTYVLYAVPPGGTAGSFMGTPLLIDVRDDKRRGAAPGPMFYKLEPLRYAVLRTSLGDMTMGFYYDTAPNTVAAFMRLAEGGFYDGLEFFRVEPGFVVQTGDPRNNGTGGPGFNVQAEFSDRQHLRGVVSLARQTDPNEAPGLLPRTEFANSGGSQFFICLDYSTTRQLDRRYTAFGRIIDGLDVLEQIAATPLQRERRFRPVNPPLVLSVSLVNVTPNDNPYARLRVVESVEVPPAATAVELPPTPTPAPAPSPAPAPAPSGPDNPSPSPR
ncbi:MAG: peptidylprolyl isomerase [Tepidisphaerales bacterium]